MTKSTFSAQRDTRQRHGEEAHGTTGVAASPTAHSELQRHLATVRRQVFQGAPIVAVTGTRDLLASGATRTLWALGFSTQADPVHSIWWRVRRGDFGSNWPTEKVLGIIAPACANIRPLQQK